MLARFPFRSDAAQRFATFSNTDTQEDFIFSSRRFRRPTLPEPAGILGISWATANVGFVACVTLKSYKALLAGFANLARIRLAIGIAAHHIAPRTQREPSSAKGSHLV